MATSIEVLHKDLTGLKKDVEFIKNILMENSELSDNAKRELKEARETSESEYIDLE